jgi:ATP-dependent exoDNAse (exonuclease V) beta subunit
MTEPGGHVPELEAADAKARAQALDTRRSFVVQAPAGSGKTELLIQRMLALLARAEQPEEVVAITFTRKAAGEMRQRVLQALDAAAGAQPPSGDHHRTTWLLARAVRERDLQDGWGLATSPDRLRIGTIDSLCAALARQLPVVSGAGGPLRTVERAQHLYREAARRALALLEEPEPPAIAVANLLRHLDNDAHAAEDLLADMLGKRDQWLRHVADRRSPRLRREQLEAALAQLIRDALDDLRARIPAALAGEMVALARAAAGNLVRAGRDSALRICAELTGLPGADPGELPSWRGLVELVLTKEGTPRVNANVNLGFPPPGEKGLDKQSKADREQLKERHAALVAQLAAHHELIAALQRCRALPPPRYGDAQWAAVDAVSALLPIAVAQFDLVCRERGETDFTAVAQAAVRALGSDEEPTDLALALDQRIAHLLVDEFQDTSQAQYELLARLTAGWTPGDGRTLFAVGDPMQSIYRFREAEVALYLRARRDGVGGVAAEPLTLAMNFRSQGALVQWVNESFARVLPEAEDLANGAVPFTPSRAAHSALPGPAVCVHALPTAERAEEARAVLDIVCAERAAQSDQHIAILVRNRAHLNDIVPALREAGIRFQAIEIEALAHRPLVQDLRTLARALLHPADRIAWLALLRAPWCGLTAPDIDALARSDHRACVWELMDRPALVDTLSADGRARLIRVRETLRHAFAQRRRESLRAWIEGAWLALGGPATAQEEADLGDAQACLALLDSLERGGELLDFAELDEHIARLFALPDAGADERLQVMTMHKAKGLEFDTVILPGLGGNSRSEAARLLRWLERPRAHGGADLLLAPIRRRGGEPDPVYDYLGLLERSRVEHETGRLLYVAATRARMRLHLLGHAPVTDGGPRPAPRSLLHKLWPVVRTQFEAGAAASAAQPPEPAAAPAPRPVPATLLRRLASDWKLPPPLAPARAAPGRIPFATEGLLEEVEFSWASESARHVGTVVHRALQRIGEDALAGWDAQTIAARAPLFSTELRSLGVPDALLDTMLERVLQALRRSLDGARARWVLGARDQAACELRLTGVLDGATVDVVLDRTFVDEQGARWIVDYKTGTHAGGSLEAFLDREQERYRDQLERYARIAHALDGRPVRLALYFPLLGAWREWAAQSGYTRDSARPASDP